MRKLSKVVGRYFDAWIDLDTWDSFHLLDLKGFYRFVKAQVRYGRKYISSGDVCTMIKAKWINRRTVDELDKAADRYAEIYETLINYESTYGFPDALIERRNIVNFHLELSLKRQGVEKKMSEVWGKDWQKKLEAARLKGVVKRAK